MLKQKIEIEHIPAVLWGGPSEKLIIAVHGSQSNKEDEVISVLASGAAAKGYQVISFDLPAHGERENEKMPLKVQNAVRDLETVMRYAKGKSENISPFACSIGAYFSLLAYKAEPLQQALFLSPIVNMERIIQNMMDWAGVSESRLKDEQEIMTASGNLYWDYYCYVKENPVEHWPSATAILYGAEDNICERDTVEEFAGRFHADLRIVNGGGHYFHTRDEMEAFMSWCEEMIL